MPGRDDNPIQDRYAKNSGTFDGLRKSEAAGTFDGDRPAEKGNAADGVREAEQAPKDNWINGVTGKGKEKAKGLFKGLKKKSAIISIIAALLGFGGLGIGTVLGPSLLINQFSSVLLSKFNLQLGSLDSRTADLYSEKTTGGLYCGSTISVLCKYSTMSEEQVGNFEDAGITVNSSGKTLLGRIKPDSFEFNGETIKASDFKSKLLNDPEFGEAVDHAYNPEFVGFADKAFSWVEEKLGISKAAANLEGDTEADQLKSLQEDTSTQEQTDSSSVTKGDQSTTSDQTLSSDQATAINDQANSISSGADSVVQTGETLGETALESAEEAASAAGDSLSLDGPAQAACHTYGLLSALGYAAKTVRATQMAKLAMVLFNVESQMRAGVASSKDVSFLGDMLTTTMKNPDTGQMESATDSFGYKYAAYGDTGGMSTVASRFMSGGGLSGELTGVTETVDSTLGGTPTKTCGIVQNPFVMGASFVGGIAALVGSWINPAGEVTGPSFSAWEITKGVGIAALYVASSFLPAMLKDVVAGVLVDKGTVGLAAGEAITSGSSVLMGTTAQAGGNAPLTPTQAVAYVNYNNETLARYAKQDQVAYSPFDASNSNTFMGKVAAFLVPYISKTSSLSGTLGSIMSLPMASLSALTTTTKAASTSEFSMCQDEQYKALGLATDPYCNVIYGIPPDALSSSPITVAKDLIAKGQIDSTTGEPVSGSTYETFVTDCINRKDPLGSKGQTNQNSDGSECKFSSSNKNYYLHYIDQRAQDTMDQKSTDFLAADSGSNTASTLPSTVDAGTVQYCTAHYNPNETSDLYKKVYGSSASAIEKELVDVDFPLKNKTVKVQFNKKAAPCLKAVAQDMATITFKPTAFDGSYNWRPNRNNPSQLSNHSFGIAIDLDAAKNPNGGGSPGHCTTTFPKDFVDIFKKYGFRWGGDFHSTCDAMHFEWLGGT